MTASDVPPCQETSGFLFSHVCGRPGVFSCARCGKRICPQHARPSPPEAFLCVSCARAQGAATDADADDEGTDPYFYADDYRRRSGVTGQSDPLDFQEGDRAALGGDEG